MDQTPEPAPSSALPRIGAVPSRVQIDDCNKAWPYNPDDPWVALTTTNQSHRITRGSIVYPSDLPPEHKEYMGTQPWIIVPSDAHQRAEVSQPLWSEGEHYMPLSKLLQHHGRELEIAGVLEGTGIELTHRGSPIEVHAACDLLVNAHLVSLLPAELQQPNSRTELGDTKIQNQLALQVTEVTSLREVLYVLENAAHSAGARDLFEEWERQILASPSFATFQVPELGIGITVSNEKDRFRICVNDPSNSFELSNMLTSDRCVQSINSSIDIPHSSHGFAVIDLEGGLQKTGVDPTLVARHAAGEHRSAFVDRCTLLGNYGIYQVHVVINLTHEASMASTTFAGATRPWRLADNRLVIRHLSETPLSLKIAVSPPVEGQPVTDTNQIAEMRDLCLSIAHKLATHHARLPDLRNETFK